jgi:hypothetical protein
MLGEALLTTRHYVGHSIVRRGDPLLVVERAAWAVSRAAARLARAIRRRRILRLLARAHGELPRHLRGRVADRHRPVSRRVDVLHGAIDDLDVEAAA